MLLGLPDIIVADIGRQYREAIDATRATYPDVREDEDSVTGALSHAMHERVCGERDGFRWDTHAKKLRGRGEGAAEKRFGADLAFEIEVSDSLGQSIKKKTLFAQAKKEWSGKDALLGDQAKKLVELPGGGIVIDYRADHFRAINATEAVRAEGNARHVEEHAFRDLGTVLGDDFLSCRIGSTAVHYDASHDQLVTVHDGELRFVKFVLARRIRTDVRPTHKVPKKR